MMFVMDTMVRCFGFLSGYIGTLMAVFYVLVMVVFVVVLGFFGLNLLLVVIERWFEKIVHDFGAFGLDVCYGWGLIDAVVVIDLVILVM